MRRIFSLSALAAMILLLMGVSATANDGGEEVVPAYVVTKDADGGFVLSGGGLGNDIKDNDINDLLINILSDTDFNGACSIRFGENLSGEEGEPLDIGDQYISFDASYEINQKWLEHITLLGKIASERDGPTVLLMGNINVVSYADIVNTDTANGVVGVNIYSAQDDDERTKFTVKSGKVIVGGEYSIYNYDGIVEVSGGLVQNTNTSSNETYAIYNTSNNGTVIVSGGTVHSEVGYAIYNESSKGVVIFGKNTTVSSGNFGTFGATVYSRNGSLTITDSAYVSNTSLTYGNTIYIASDGAQGEIEISNGAKIFANGAPEGTVNAIYNNSTRPVNINGASVSANCGYAVYNNNNADLTIIGGEVLAHNSGNAISNIMEGNITVSGAKVAAGEFPAIYNGTWGNITVSDSSIIYSNNTSSGSGTIYNESGSIIIEYGFVINDTADGNAIYNSGEGSVTVDSGLVSALGKGYAIRSGASQGSKVTINGGQIKGEGTGLIGLGGGAVHNGTFGELVITGGQIEAVDGAAVENHSSNDLEISGGQISAEAGAAILNLSNGKISILENVKITSQNTDDGSDGSDKVNGTIVNADEGIIEIIGAQISNTAAPSPRIKNAIYNKLDIGGQIVLGASPRITGIIAIDGDFRGSTLRVLVYEGDGNNFAPAQGEKYLLNFLTGRPSPGTAVVTDGANFAEYFQLHNGSNNITNRFLAADADSINLIAIQAYSVTFNLNEDGGGTPVCTLYVAEGATVDISLAPDTDQFTKENYRHDGKWHRRMGSSVFSYSDFEFGENGTPVNSDIVLALKWESTNVSILKHNRDPRPNVPNPNTQFLPDLSITAAEFSAGPNPVARTQKKVNFFRVGPPIKNTVLTVFNASGNVVNRIKISDTGNLTANSKRVVGSWNLTDTKSRPAAPGTYFVKGTIITADGGKERVSLLIGVK